MAYVTVETHSINDIIQLTRNLNAALAMRGTLKGIPFVLSRRPQEISTPGKDGKRQRFVKWLLFLEPDPAWVAIQLAAMHQNAMALPPGLPLSTSDEVEEVEGDEVEEVEEVEGDEVEEVERGHFAPPVPPATTAAQNTLHALGSAFYGDAWNEQRHALASAVSRGRTKSSRELQSGEIVQLIGGVERRIRDAYAALVEEKSKFPGFDPAMLSEVDNMAGVELARAFRILNAWKPDAT
jgi:hypothetical protein